MTATAEKIDVYQIVTDQITALLEAGTVPWRKPWNGDGKAINLASKRPLITFLTATTTRGNNYA